MVHSPSFRPDYSGLRLAKLSQIFACPGHLKLHPDNIILTLIAFGHDLMRDNHLIRKLTVPDNYRDQGQLLR